LNFHLDGRRFANSEINNFNITGYTGMSGYSQNNYVTSIGKWRPANTSADGTNSVTSVYRYGAADWDGDIAEILVFNEKLSNSNIALAEGYLAHKYGLQENLIHKDGATNFANNVHRWEFPYDNLDVGAGIGSDGWRFYTDDSPDGSSVGMTKSILTTPEIGLRLTISSGAESFYMTLDDAQYVDASAYDRFVIYFRPVSGAEGHSARAILKWSYIDDNGVSGDDQTDTHASGTWAAGPTTIEYDLSSESNWKGKITSLTYVFDHDPDGGQQYDLFHAYLSGVNHPHPYRWNAPPSIGANSWNTSY